uniref:hypothetical protein n=1 Tax=Serratia quinivorans TaxID=137545 RepID=UPI0035C67883
HLNSAFSFFNYPVNPVTKGKDESIQWGDMNRACHPLFTNYRFNFKECIDYIYYNPKTMIVEKLLELPDI